MTYVLIPGRHLVMTKFQEHYFSEILNQASDAVQTIGTPPAGTLNSLVFAITSANQQHSRYNPFPFEIRAIGVDRFVRTLKQSFDISHTIFGIPHYNGTNKFAEITLKEIDEQSEHNLALTPENTIVLCSTPAVIKAYRALGFSILPAELTDLDSKTYRGPVPIEVVQSVVAAGENWLHDQKVCEQLSTATKSVWIDFPQMPKRLLRIYREPLLNDQGSLTETRNYNTYAYGMSNPAIIAAKYDDIQHAIIPDGKLVDEGCADGALLERICHDNPDIDLIGIDLAGDFLARAAERQRAGAFDKSFVHFHQRNLTQPIFDPESITTTICNATTHELWSYAGGKTTVEQYFAEKYRQTRKGGRLIIRDVVGPENKEREIYLMCADDDGTNENPLRVCSSPQELGNHLRSLSTKARFIRFTHDYLAHRGLQARVHFRTEQVADKEYFVLPFKDATEFITKKDYADNWESELHEEFAFWSFNEWKNAVQRAGFRVLEDQNNSRVCSRVYTSEWIQKNSWNGHVAIYEQTDKGLSRIPYPPTTMVLIADKVA